MKQYVSIIVACGLLLSACRSTRVDAPLHQLVLQSPEGNTATLQVEWASTPEEQKTGLMHRQVVDHGMLFLFPTEATRTFWMKDTLVPLDILFFDAKGGFVSKTSMVPCKADPCREYPSFAPAKFALETPAGYLTLVNVGPGWTIQSDEVK